MYFPCIFAVLFSVLQRTEGNVKSLINVISQQCLLPCHVVNVDGLKNFCCVDWMSSVFLLHVFRVCVCCFTCIISVFAAGFSQWKCFWDVVVRLPSATVFYLLGEHLFAIIILTFFLITSS